MRFSHPLPPRSDNLESGFGFFFIYFLVTQSAFSAASQAIRMPFIEHSISARECIVTSENNNLLNSYINSIRDVLSKLLWVKFFSWERTGSNWNRFISDIKTYSFSLCHVYMRVISTRTSQGSVLLGWLLKNWQYLPQPDLLGLVGSVTSPISLGTRLCVSF